MSEAFFSAAAGVLVTLIFVGIAGAILMRSGYEFKASEVNLGFVKFDTSSFGDLSVVKLFANVSTMVISPSIDARKWFDHSPPDVTPILLIHIGWNIVADAYAGRYYSYPSEEDALLRTSDIGPQNVEFIITFKRIYDQSIRYTQTVDMDFAREYFLRAPSLATRIAGFDFADQEELFHQIGRLLPRKKPESHTETDDSLP